MMKPMSYFESDGLTIHFESWGAGHPMILVHGWGSDIRGNWIDTGWVEALSPHRRVIAFDCRGHGKSDKPHEQALYGYHPLSRDVIALMDHLEIQAADYLGYSMGAFMGAALLRNHSGRFTSMVLGGIGDETAESAAACETIAAALRAPDVASIEDVASRAYRRFVSANPDNDLEALALSALQMWREGFPLELAGTNPNAAGSPVLIVNGTEDRPYVDTGRKLAHAIPAASLHEIPGTDHMTAVPHPDFKRATLAFIKGSESTPVRL